MSTALSGTIGTAVTSKRGGVDDEDKHNKRQRSDNHTNTTSSLSSSSAPSIGDDDDDDDNEQTVIMLPQYNPELAAAQQNKPRPILRSATRTRPQRGRIRSTISTHARGRGSTRGDGKTMSSSKPNETVTTEATTQTLQTAPSPSSSSLSSTLTVASKLVGNGDNDDINVPSKRMARVMAAHRERQRALMEEASEMAQRRALGLEESNDPLYDPLEDEANEAFASGVEAARRMFPQTSNKNQSSFKSHAVLSCPCCFTNLCYNCQQHEEYEGQYRAIFVENCVDDTTTAASETKARPIQGDDPKQRYVSVACSTCGTIVASRDQDEVYYFYNVIASPPLHAPVRSSRQLPDEADNDNENDEDDDEG